MQIGKKISNSVYVKVSSYKDKKLSQNGGLTVYDADPDKVLAIVKKALERAAANGKR